MTSESIWRKFGFLLSPFSLLYGFAVSIRNFCYDRGIFKIHRLPVPVISIGNISVGGTGKTPLTLSLANILQATPYKLNPAVLSRGYGRKSTGYQLVSDGKKVTCDWLVSGDEAQIYANRLHRVPVAVDASRVNGGHNLIEEYSPSVILLDDAFQHRRIHRDLDLVVMDANHLPDELNLLPAGSLREPSRALERADLIVLTHFVPDDPKSEESWSYYEQKQGQKKLSACRLKVSGCSLLRTRKKIPTANLKDKKLIAFCGIGTPESFLETLDELECEVSHLIRFPDHHHYKTRDVERLAAAFNSSGVDYLITTEKDAVKLGGLFEALPILILEVEIEWLRGQENLFNRLTSLFN